MTDTVTETPVRPGRPARPSLRHLVWVVWRQHRTAVLAITAVLVICGLILLWDGLGMHADFKKLGLADCVPGAAHQAQHCATRLDAFGTDQNRVTQLTAYFLPLPVLFGLFLGAPLLAREYESGSFRFAFTQGVGRTRWLMTKLVLLGAFTVAATLVFTFVVVWWYGPLVALNGRLGAGTVFEIYGPVFVARALFAFTLGVLVGALVRRTVPAIAVTLAVWVGVVVLAIAVLRAHLLPPLTALNSTVPGRPWILTDTWTSPTGQRLTTTQVSDLQYNAALAGHKLDNLQYLAQKGYHQAMTYQPAGRFWPFQWIETGALALLAAGFAAAAVWLIRRRAT
jgi:ABC-type transport system involved in multi-copper enzyme maturation permease subunit